MKQISLAAAIVLLVVAVALFLRDRSARAALRNAETQITTLSNEVAKANTFMVMHGVTNAALNQQLVKYLERMSGLSNHMAKTSENLKQLQQEHGAAKTNLEGQTRKANQEQLRVTELERDVRALRATLEARETDIARLGNTLKDSERARAEQHARLQRAEAEVVRLQLDQMDETALRAQLTRLKRQWPPLGFAKSPDQPFRVEEKGAKGLTAKVDTKATGYYLQMQPDGTVKLVPSFEAAGATR